MVDELLFRNSLVAFRSIKFSETSPPLACCEVRATRAVEENGGQRMCTAPV